MADRDGAIRALDDVVRERAACPVSVTPSTRAATRYGALMELAEPLLDEDRRALVREVVSLAEAHDVPAPTVTSRWPR